MISNTSPHPARVLPFEDSTSWNATLDLAAIRSDDGARTVLRVVNTAAAAKAARITLGGWQCAGDASVAAVELYADDLSEVNPPAQPRRVAPRAGPTVSVADDGVLAYEFRGDSFTPRTTNLTFNHSQLTNNILLSHKSTKAFVSKSSRLWEPHTCHR